MAKFEVRLQNGDTDDVDAERASVEGGRLTFFDADGNAVAGYMTFTSFKQVTDKAAE